jgi:hypothetical protein
MVNDAVFVLLLNIKLVLALAADELINDKSA